MKKSISLFALLAFLFSCSFHTLYAQSPCRMDSTWDTDGRMVGPYGRMGELIHTTVDGKVLVGAQTFGNGPSYLYQYNPDGSLDPAFGNNGTYTLEVAERATNIYGLTERNGVYYICGTTTTDIGGTNTYAFATAITTGGSLVTSFGTNGVKEFRYGALDFYTSRAIATDDQGNLYMTGLEWLDNIYVVKMNSQGVLDPGFGNNGVAMVGTNDPNKWFEANDVTIDRNGDVMVAGMRQRANNGNNDPAFQNFMAMRFTQQGNLDPSFGTGGIVLANASAASMDRAYRIHVTGANEYYLTGHSYEGDHDFAALKLDASGTPIPTYGTGGWRRVDVHGAHESDACYNSALLPDGRLLMAGVHGDGDTVYFALQMLLQDGSLDQVFAPDGLFKNIFNQNNNSAGGALDVSSDGKITMAGYTRTCTNGTCGPLYMAVGRYHNTFGPVTAVAEPQAAAPLAYPNPAVAGQTIRIETVGMAAPSGASWFSLSGQLVGEGMQVPDLAPGLYLLRVTQEGRQSHHRIQVR